MLNFGTLFVCATPIGNLQDCTFRLIDTLKHVNLIATEDTRKTKILLTKFNIATKCISLEKHNEASRIDTIIKLLEKGQNIALLSEAGTPNISDPGSYLIEQVIKSNYKIVPIPGPSSVTATLSISGFLANQFFFAGFFPKTSALFNKILNQIPQTNIPIVFFETSKRLEKSLALLSNTNPEITLFCTKELTKIHEAYFKGTPNQVIEQLSCVAIKGEWCLVIKLPKNQYKEQKNNFDINWLKSIGLTNKQILEIAQNMLKLPKNEIKRQLFSK